MRWYVGAAAALVTAVMVVGCAPTPQIVTREDYLAEGVRNYHGETRERVISAAEKVLRQSDPNNWDFRYSLNGFTGLRKYVVYAIIASARGREKWDFLAEPETGGIKASISISDAGVASGGYSSSIYEGKMASIPLYRLFWNRVDYMLGRRPDWITCEDAEKALPEKHSPDTLSGLCGGTSAGRFNEEAPEPLPPVVAAPVTAPKKFNTKRKPPKQKAKARRLVRPPSASRMMRAS